MHRFWSDLITDRAGAHAIVLTDAGAAVVAAALAVGGRVAGCTDRQAMQVATGVSRSPVMVEAQAVRCGVEVEALVEREDGEG